MSDSTVDPTSDAASSGPAESGSLRTLERGLLVLELLAQSNSGLTFSEVRERVGLSAGTVSRLLQTLVKRGYVEQDRRSKAYLLGLQLLELQGSTLASNRMASEARPHLLELMRATGCRVHLAVYRGGDHLVYVDRVDNQQSIARYSPVARGGPLHATSLGKAILAFSTPEVRSEYLAISKRQKLTPATLTDAAALNAEFEEIRSRGYATEFGESDVDIYCVGAPVRDYTGAVIAAVSVAGDRDEMAPRVEELAELVRATATKVSSAFGYRESAY